MQEAESRDYALLQHAHQTLTNKEEPISIHRMPLPFVANHLFSIKTHLYPAPPRVAPILSSRSRPQHPETSQEKQEEEMEETGFDIGEKEESTEVVKLGLKGMKSLANVSSYLSSFISKKK